MNDTQANLATAATIAGIGIGGSLLYRGAKDLITGGYKAPVYLNVPKEEDYLDPRDLNRAKQHLNKAYSQYDNYRTTGDEDSLTDAISDYNSAIAIQPKMLSKVASLKTKALAIGAGGAAVGLMGYGARNKWKDYKSDLDLNRSDPEKFRHNMQVRKGVYHHMTSRHAAYHGAKKSLKDLVDKSGYEPKGTWDDYDTEAADHYDDYWNLLHSDDSPRESIDRAYYKYSLSKNLQNHLE